jgi:FAD synthase
MWIRRKVKKGTGTGRKIGFPTLNFNVGQFGENYGEGVYLSEVKINKTVYKGALFFGTRMNSGKKALEIYVIGFNKMIYNQFVRFRVIKKIRKPKKFKGLEELKKQINEDLKNI